MALCQLNVYVPTANGFFSYAVYPNAYGKKPTNQLYWKLLCVCVTVANVVFDVININLYNNIADGICTFGFTGVIVHIRSYKLLINRSFSTNR